MESQMKKTEERENNVYVHYCGGCGINIAIDVMKKVCDNGQGGGLPSIEHNYIDTSRANIKGVNVPILEGEFWKIETKNHDTPLIDGSGGERSTHASDILSSMHSYLDNKGIKEPVTGEYHLVIFSASGGTGNIAAYGIVNKLLSLKIPCICVCVGDSSTSISTSNTIKVIETFNALAVNTKTALCMIYDNNVNLSDEESKCNAEQIINDRLYNTITTTLLFLSAGINSIDNKDMQNFLNQVDYASLKIQPGLYGIQTFAGRPQDNIPKSYTPTGARTIVITPEKNVDKETHTNLDTDTGFILLHTKKGHSSHVTHRKLFPPVVHLITFAGALTDEHRALSTTLNEFNTIAKSIVSDSLGTDAGTMNNDGLVL